MKENKKIQLNDDELEQVTGGAVEYQDLLRPIIHVDEYRCAYCNRDFSTAYDRNEHEKTCPERPS